MKKIVLYFTTLIVSVNCMGQNKISTLKQVDFNDKILEKILVSIVKTDTECFNRTDFYVLDFFQSSVSSNQYYLSINEFVFNSNTQNSITYYVIINNVVFFVPNKTPNGLFNVLSEKKTFNIKTETIPHPGGDYNFLIYGTLNGYYKVIYKTCAE